MNIGKACDTTTTGEVRMRIDGGLAHFPGLAKERTISFRDLDATAREQLADLAKNADFFECEPVSGCARADARTYTLGLTIDGRSRDLEIAEPIGDPAMAQLISTVRRLSKTHPKPA